MQNSIKNSAQLFRQVFQRDCQRDVLRGLQLNLQRLLIVGSVALVVGCGTATVQETAPVPQRSDLALGSASSLPEGSIRYDTEDARIAQLWSAAEQARLEANNDLALRRLFEALELAPQNGLLWSRAAEIQLDNEQALLAEDFASKSNTFAGTNASLLHRNWLIIEHARSLRGDLLGVRSAHKKVQEYQYQ